MVFYRRPSRGGRRKRLTTLVVPAKGISPVVIPPGTQNDVAAATCRAEAQQGSV